MATKDIAYVFLHAVARISLGLNVKIGLRPKAIVGGVYSLVTHAHTIAVALLGLAKPKFNLYV